MKTAQNPDPKKPEKNDPTRKEPNPDPSRKVPERNDPTRQPEPGHNDPTRKPEVPPKPQAKK